MGSGKTTLGRALHGAIGPDGVRLRFVDLDEAVEQAEGATVAKPFEETAVSLFAMYISLSSIRVLYLIYITFRTRLEQKF